MPTIRVESHELHPFRADIEVITFEAGEYVPIKSRDYPEQATEEKRGETQVVKGINTLYYDKNNDSGNPDWVVMAESSNVNPFYIDVSEIMRELAELKAEQPTEPAVAPQTLTQSPIVSPEEQPREPTV